MGCDIAACVASDVPTVKCQFYLSCDKDSGFGFTTPHHMPFCICLSAIYVNGLWTIREGRDESPKPLKRGRTAGRSEDQQQVNACPCRRRAIQKDQQR